MSVISMNFEKLINEKLPTKSINLITNKIDIKKKVNQKEKKLFLEIINKSDDQATLSKLAFYSFQHDLTIEEIIELYLKSY